jgi:demethylmenaquinone methyltransferase/2-methoxy-6-polyprenyl-1,4-benzoquinol methylase
MRQTPLQEKVSSTEILELVWMAPESVLDIARWYEPLFGEVLSGLREMAVRLSRPKKGMKVLDIGCGTGVQLAFFQSTGCDVFGIDLSGSMLKVARKELDRAAELQNCNATQLPYLNGTFDLVLSSLFLHQLSPEMRSASLREAIRVMRADGNLLLIDLHPVGDGSIKRKLTKFSISTVELLAGREHFSNSRIFLSRGGIPGLAEEYNLQMRKKFLVADGNLGIYLLSLHRE